MNENKETLIMELHENELTEMISINVICRLCANQNDKLIGIYSEDGITNDLANKMNTYLPIKVNETDDLPLQCCWQCASTILAWHDLVITSAEADRRLRSYQFVTERQLQDVQMNFQTEESCHSSEKREEVEPDHASLNAFCQADANTQSTAEKIKDSKSPTESDFVPSNDNLSDFASIEPQYLELHNSLYDIKMEDKNLEAKENVALPPIYQETDDSLSDNNGKKEENLTMYNYSCQFCPLVFLMEEDVINHITETHPDADLKGDALSQEALQSLKKKKRKNNKIDQDLVNSAKVVVEGRIYYNCKECGKSLHSPYTYVWHMRIHTGERPNVCDLCGKQFRVSQGLVRHLKETHARIKNFACDLCGRMFATRRNVEEHRRIHTNERPYICDLCGKSFKQKASLFVHNRSHTNTFPFKCTYCAQAFRTKPPLLLHVTKHTGEKPYPCDVCGRSFRIKYELKRHRLIHSDEKPFVCSTCGLSFRQKRYLRNHNKLNHTVQFQEKSDEVKEYLFYDNISEGESSSFGDTPTVNKFDAREQSDLPTASKKSVDDSSTCDLCCKAFETRPLLNKHMKDIHEIKLQKFRRKKSEIDATFICPVCGNAYTRKFDMQKHIKSKHPNQREDIVESNRAKNMGVLIRCRVLSSEGNCYKCDICGQLFRKSHSFIRHRNTHSNEKPYCCHICGRKFVVSSALVRHINQHHYGIKNYACSVCGRKFSAKTTRDEHMNIHTDVRPFVCDMCGKSFKQNSSLHIHKMYHTNVFPFSCNVCCKKFRRKGDLKVHNWTHTGEKPHQCKQCDMSFRLGQDLKRHTKIHVDYFCDVCGLKFQQERFLQNHLKIHECGSTD